MRRWQLRLQSVGFLLIIGIYEWTTAVNVWKFVHQQRHLQAKPSSMFTIDSCPPLVTRAEWGAVPPKTTPQPLARPVPMVFIHHTEMPGECSNETDCAAAVRSIQTFHMQVRGWDDIGYNFLVGGDGRVYEGRGWAGVGAHAKGWNFQSYGMAMIGDFSQHLPTDAALKTVQQLILCGQPQNISIEYTLHGHRDGVCTSCPGDKLYSLISNWPHFTGKLHPVIC